MLSRIACVTSLALLVIVGTVYGTTPPPLTNLIPQMATPQPPHLLPMPPAKTPPAVWTPELVKSLGLSTAVTMDILSHMPQPTNATAADEMPQTLSGEMQRLRRTSQTSVTATTYPVTNDTPQDIEPAVITDTFQHPDGSSYYRTSGVWIKEQGTPASPTPNLFWTTTTDFVNFAGYPTGQTLQTTQIANTTRSADPWLSENPYLSTGVAGKRTYCSGVAYGLQANGLTAHSTLDVWYNDDPGSQQWQLFGGSPIAQDDYPWFYDKPSITTSWYNPNSCCSTLGWTYVAAVHANQAAGGTHVIEVYRNTGSDGTQQTFQLINNQFAGTGYTSPVILVDSASGYLYLVWLDQTSRVINVAKSTDGTTFSIVGTVTPPNPIICPTFDNNQINGNVQAETVVMAQYNSYDRSIGIVWHNVEGGNSSATDVYFVRYSILYNTLSSPVHVGNTPINDGRDQWNPALDCDTNGNYLVTWYDRRNDAADISYQVYATKIHADGTPIDTIDTMTYDARAAANTNDLTLLTPQGIRIMGEYQGVWEWYGTWYTATSYITSSGSQDMFMPQVNP